MKHISKILTVEILNQNIKVIYSVCSSISPYLSLAYPLTSVAYRVDPLSPSYAHSVDPLTSSGRHSLDPLASSVTRSVDPFIFLIEVLPAGCLLSCKWPVFTNII